MKSVGPKILALLLVASFGGEALSADSPPSTAKRPKVDVALVTDSPVATPGETVRVGVQFKMAPKWHIYWHSPGDSGLPTELAITAPDGWSVERMNWPAPKRYVDTLGGATHGYGGEVLLYRDVQVPADITEGVDIPITADVKWLVCERNCIPGKATLGTTLKVASTKPDGVHAPKALFDRYSKLVPVDPPKSLSFSSVVTPEAVAPGESFTLKVAIKDTGGTALAYAKEDVANAFIPAPAKGLEITSVASHVVDGGLGLTLEGRASTTAADNGAKVGGVLHLKTGSYEVSYDVARKAGAATSVAPVEAAGAAASVNAGNANVRSVAEVCEGTEKLAGDGGSSGKLSSFWLALLFAFLGGLILNVMPCVLPVLSIKVLSLVEQSGEDKKTIWRHGLAYTAGVLLSFLAFALIVIGIKAGGGLASWSFQFQDPMFVGIFAAVVFALALSLFGVFELTLPGMSKMDQAVQGSHGYTSSFNYGIFAVLLGTPCTAPMLGPAMAYAFTQPPLELIMLLMAVGFGLAFPFLMLARFPQWTRLLPKPGPWLTTFKKIMAFLLVGTAVWMVTVLAKQLSRDALNSYLWFMAILAFALFVYGHWAGPIASTKSRVIGILAAVGLMVAGSYYFFDLEPPAAAPAGATTMAGGIEWENFDTVDVKELASGGQTVFIDFTADWCQTCKVNEASAIYTDRVREGFASLGVVAVKGDFTSHKPVIAEWLKRFNEPSVPLYVVLPAGRPEAAIKLPTFPLSTDDVLNGICTAGPSGVRTASN